MRHAVGTLPMLGGIVVPQWSSHLSVVKKQRPRTCPTSSNLSLYFSLTFPGDSDSCMVLLSYNICSQVFTVGGGESVCCGG